MTVVDFEFEKWSFVTYTWLKWVLIYINSDCRNTSERDLCTGAALMPQMPLRTPHSIPGNWAAAFW